MQDSVCGGRHTLILSGELDMGSAGALEAMIGHLCSNATTAIALDLSKLAFMDSTGLYAVLRADKLCREQACEFSVAPGTGQARRLLEVCGVIGAPFVEAPAR